MYPIKYYSDSSWLTESQVDTSMSKINLDAKSTYKILKNLQKLLCTLWTSAVRLLCLHNMSTDCLSI